MMMNIQELDLIFIIFSLIFGACFGSFITMASYRLPRNEDIFFKKSYCPKCNQAISIKSLIPIFSYLFQKGKCSKCGNKISFRYPLTEIATSLMFLFSYLKFGYSYNTIIVDLIITTCIIMVITDLETYTIPDSTQVVLLILNIILILFNKFDIFYSLLSSFIYFLIIFLTGYIVKKIKKEESIGGADVKFITIVGLLLSIYYLPLFLFISGFSGLIFGLIWKKVKKSKYFPFGPALIFAYLSILFIFF